MPGEYVAGVRFRAWSPPSALHPTIGVQAPLMFDLVDTWARPRARRLHLPRRRIPAGATTTTFPVNANEAEARRVARFWAHGHTPGPMAAAPTSRPIRPRRRRSTCAGSRRALTAHGGRSARSGKMAILCPRIPAVTDRSAPASPPAHRLPPPRRRRTALFAWAFARRHHGGTFILRIEDTDVERSTPEAVQAILDAMDWLGLDYDEGPFYQMQRMDRYRAVIADMLERGLAYRCYMSPDELDALRAEQMARGEKPRYDGRWRPENARGHDAAARRRRR